MKKSRFFLAILAMVVTAIVSIAVVSCKKESPDAMLNNTQPAKTFTVPQVDDMNAYLKDFKQRMQTSKDGETLTLEEAAWYLSSLANYDFANVNVQFTDLRYDTLYYQMNVTNGQVSSFDLNTVYASMASDIDALYHSLDLQDKHFRFIGASISEDGLVTIDLIISYFVLDHTWYFEDDFNAALACYEWFDSNAQYSWNTSAISQLENAINFFEGKYYISPGETPTQRDYYIHTMTLQFTHEDNIDTLGSPFYGNSRVYVTRSNGWTTPYLDFYDMCYCLDSYLALPFEYLREHPTIPLDRRPIHWNIIPEESYYDMTYYFSHKVMVKLGILVAGGDSNNY